ncbi:MAG: hypothetical protein MJ236_00865, partial [Clostridia bacterium]|nr:hypothetical protein [Clostridia bacterium]
MLTESPDTFRNGQIWNIIISINDAMKGIGTALLVIFFMTGVIKTYSSFSEVKRFESAFRLFLRFSIAKVLISYGLDIMISIFKICEGVILKISETYGISNIYFKLPSEITNALNGISLLDSIPIWCVSILGSLVIWVLSIVLILTVYGRFFKMYMYVAISPIPLSSFAGESTSHIG